MTQSQNEFKLEELKKQAIALMTKEGFSMEGEVHVELDPELAFMGYTIERHGKPHIVISGNALKGRMAINLMIHELSHVYRSQQGHPSHDYRMLTDIASWAMKGKVVEAYQDKIVEGILNHLQDIYADDISFRIFKKEKEKPDLSKFFLSWIRMPSNDKDPVKNKWENADVIVSAAFAQANLERHNIADTDGEVAKTINAFLKEFPKESAEKFAFFKKFMVLLPEEVTDKNFEKLLITYLSEFSKLLK